MTPVPQEKMLALLKCMEDFICFSTSSTIGLGTSALPQAPRIFKLMAMARRSGWKILEKHPKLLFKLCRVTESTFLKPLLLKCVLFGLVVVGVYGGYRLYQVVRDGWAKEAPNPTL